jgi:hypothetical protein
MSIIMETPRSPESLGLCGKSSKTVRSAPAAVQPVKHVSFNKDIVTKKMIFFTDLVTHFNSLSNDEAGGGIASQAKSWLATQMASDLFHTLRLDSFGWEFDTAKKQYSSPVKKNKDAELDSILLDKPVEQFLKEGGNYGDAIEIEVNAEDEDKWSDLFTGIRRGKKPKVVVEDRKKIKPVGNARPSVKPEKQLPKSVFSQPLKNEYGSYDLLRQEAKALFGINYSNMFDRIMELTKDNQKRSKLVKKTSRKRKTKNKVHK